MNKLKELYPTIRKLPPRLVDRVLMMNMAQPVLGKFSKEANPERWIFIIGCYNSGTTLLANILRAHPLIGGLRTEGAYLTDSLPYPEQFGWPRMWCRCLDQIRIKNGADSGKVATRIKRQWSPWIPKYTPNLVEKTISNAVRIPFLNNFFKPAYFIYIIRNGYAVSSGIQAKANLARWKNKYYTKYPIELCAEQWYMTDKIVTDDMDKATNVLQIYYEDLVSEPSVEIKKITNFIGVEAFPDSALNQRWIVHGQKSNIRDMNKDSLHRLSKNDFRKIENIAGECLTKHGYRV